MYCRNIPHKRVLTFRAKVRLRLFFPRLLPFFRARETFLWYLLQIILYIYYIHFYYVIYFLNTHTHTYLYIYIYIYIYIYAHFTELYTHAIPFFIYVYNNMNYINYINYIYVIYFDRKRIILPFKFPDIEHNIIASALGRKSGTSSFLERKLMQRAVTELYIPIVSRSFFPKT